MSQIYKRVTSGVLPPDVPLEFQTDNGVAVPAANILNVLANDTNINNDNGIQTIGSGNTVTVQLTNRITGFVTTTDATPTTLVSVSLGAIPGTYSATGEVLAYNVTDAAGANYVFNGGAVTDGAVATEIGSETSNEFEQAAMAASDYSFGVTGNNAFVTVVGIVGKTINWNCLFTYRYIG